jgi:peptidoglycan/xylan/chitin deacetylase (PgdA/CDA1 family)
MLEHARLPAASYSVNASLKTTPINTLQKPHWNGTNMRWIDNSLRLLVVGGLLLGGMPLWGAENVGAMKGQRKEGTKATPIQPRFEIKDRDWPIQYGQASLCLWKEDALAVFSITIDDNSAPDHAWWLSMGEKYGFRFTWFVITTRISTGKNATFDGTWERWRKIHAAGHDVQSHTCLHGHIDDPQWKGIEAEYANSKKAIEENIPGNKCLVLAYYGGKNSELNDVAIAAKYYIGARGGTGSLNAANQVNYRNTNNLGGIPNIGDARFPSQDMKNILKKGSGSAARFYRGWYNSNFHWLGRTDENREALDKRLAVVKGLVDEGKLWMALFREVIQYGQERDTAQLKVSEKAPGRIVFNLTDAMDDARFDFPLTVKVRLDQSWKTLKATQNAKAIQAALVEHEGATYALVQAIPDRGEVTLKNRSN